jgi:Putative Ig domain
MSDRGRLLGGVSALFLLAGCTASTSPTASTSSEPSSSPSASASASAESSPSASATAAPSASAPAIAGLPVHNGEVGVGYLAVTFAAKNGTPPYSWSVASGTVPPGLSLSPAGALTGKNTTAGVFSFVAKVTDSAGGTASGNVKLTVFPAFAATSLCAKACNVGAQCTACGTFGKISGGAGPYTYKLVSGLTPAGMQWNKALSLVGPFPAPPPPNLAAGPPPPPQPFTVQVTDDFGVTKTVTAYWNVFTGVDFGTSTSAGCYNGPGSCSDSSLTYSGGNPADNMAVVVVKACYDDPNAKYVCSDDAGAGPLASYLPPGWSAKASGGTVTVGMDCGNPDTCAAKTGYPGWYGDVYIVLRDKGACVAPANVQSPQTADVNIDI